MAKGILETLLLSSIITFSSCISQQHNITEGSGCVTKVWYKAPTTANPYSIYTTLDVTDSSLFFQLITNITKYKLKYQGTIYSVDTFHLLSPSSAAYFKDSSLIIVHNCSNLAYYPKSLLDSLFNKTNLDISIEIEDTLTMQKWEFKSCLDSRPHSKEEWKKSIPKWLFLHD